MVTAKRGDAPTTGLDLETPIFETEMKLNRRPQTKLAMPARKISANALHPRESRFAPSIATAKTDVATAPTMRETMTPVVGLTCWMLRRAKNAVAPNPAAADSARRTPTTPALRGMSRPNPLLSTARR